MTRDKRRRRAMNKRKQPTNTTQGVRVAIYTRVSSKKQEEHGASLETQLAECERYAADHGYTVVGRYEEVFSGAELWDRQQLTALRDSVKRGEVDVVLIHQSDR